MAAGMVIRVCLLLYCLALLHRSAQSVRPLTDAGVLPASSDPLAQRELPVANLNASKLQFASGLNSKIPSSTRSSRRRRSLKAKPVAPSAAPGGAAPPPPSASTNFVEEGW